MIDANTRKDKKREAIRRLAGGVTLTKIFTTAA
jgi:hypothetical protein